MNELAPFSDWTLSLVPRLFLYPGGAGLLAALLFLRLLVGGHGALSPRQLAKSLLSANLPSLAVTWAAMALLPLPGTQPLTLPADRFTLAALLALSLLLDRPSAEEGWLGAGITLALMAPVAEGDSLLLAPDTQTLSHWVSMLAVLVGLAGLMSIDRSNLSAQVRCLAWLGVSAWPLCGWAQQQFALPGALIVSVTYVGALAVIALMSRLVIRLGWGWIAMYLLWGSGALSLLVALL